MCEAARRPIQGRPDEENFAIDMRFCVLDGCVENLVIHEPGGRIDQQHRVAIVMFGDFINQGA